MKTDKDFATVRRFDFRTPRVPTNFSFSLDVASTRTRYQAVCTDISENGLAAEILEPLAPKTLATLRLLLPGGVAPLEIRGSVEYSHGGRCGLTFLYSSWEERDQVQKFIQSIS